MFDLFESLRPVSRASAFPTSWLPEEVQDQGGDIRVFDAQILGEGQAVVTQAISSAGPNIY